MNFKSPQNSNKILQLKLVEATQHNNFLVKNFALFVILNSFQDLINMLNWIDPEINSG